MPSDTFESDSGVQQVGIENRISRRKLIASIGIVGATTVASTMFGQNSVFGKGKGNTVTQSVYGSGGVGVGACCIPITLADLRASSEPLSNDLYYITDARQEGHFIGDASDTVSTDNTGTVVVSASGVRYKRIISTDFVNVKWFGARGDGLTDDTLAVQNADDTAAALSKRLYFPSGTYMTYGLLIHTSWFSYEGATVKNNSPGSNKFNFLRIIGQNGIEIAGLTFDGAVSPDPAAWSSSNYDSFTGALAFVVYNSSNIHLQQCVFQNSVMSTLRIESCNSVTVVDCTMRKARGNFGDAVYVVGSRNVKFDRCLAEDYTRIGFVSESKSTNLSYSQCYARFGHDQSKLYGGGEYNTGFWAENSENVTYSQCVAENNTQSGFTVAPGVNRLHETAAAAFVLDSCMAIDNLYGIIASDSVADCFSVTCSGCYVTGSRYGVAINAYHPNDVVRLNECSIQLRVSAPGEQAIGIICSGNDSQSTIQISNCTFDHNGIDMNSFTSITSRAGDIVVYNQAKFHMHIDRCTCVSTSEPIYLKALQGSPLLKAANSFLAIPMLYDFVGAYFENCKFSDNKHVFGGFYTTAEIHFHKCSVFGGMNLTTTGRILFEDVGFALSGSKMIFIARTAENKNILLEFVNCRFEKDINTSDYIVRIQEEGTIKPTTLFKGCVFYNVNDVITSTNTFVWIVRTGTNYYYSECYSDDTVQNPLKVNTSLTIPSGNVMLDLH